MTSEYRVRHEADTRAKPIKRPIKWTIPWNQENFVVMTSSWGSQASVSLWLERFLNLMMMLTWQGLGFYTMTYSSWWDGLGRVFMYKGTCVPLFVWLFDILHHITKSIIQTYKHPFSREKKQHNQVRNMYLPQALTAESSALESRQIGGGNYRYRTRRTSPWSRFGRWVLAGVSIFVALVFLLMVL